VGPGTGVHGGCEIIGNMNILIEEILFFAGNSFCLTEPNKWTLKINTIFFLN
jgi:hypothetical protein